MNIVTKSVLTLSIGLALSSAVSAQSAVTPAPKPANEPAKVEPGKHKAPAAPQESNKAVQPLAASKQLTTKSKDSKESSAVPAVKAKHEKPVSSSPASTPVAKPEPSAKPSK